MREEEESSTLEPGEVELHRQAAREGERTNEIRRSIERIAFLGADLSDLLRQNLHAIAARNAQGKTPRELAVDAGLDDNAEQIGSTFHF